MFLTVNGKQHEHGGDGTVPALLAELGATPEHTALTVNGELVFCHSLRSLPRNNAASLASLGSKHWKTHKLNDGDIVEVLTFVGGG
jgi:sulfur carrier protein